MNVPLDLTMPEVLLRANSRIADLELELARARPYVVACASELHVQPEGKEAFRLVLASIDRALHGTIYSFTPHGPHR